MADAFESDMFAAVTEHLDTTNTVVIITRRADGTEKETPIWSTVFDGTPYVRSAFGPDSWWYKRAIASWTAAFDVDGRRIDVRLEHIEDAATISGIDDAFSAKYAAEAADLVPMLTDESRACTLRVLPA
jgi:hypothetical protein